MLEIEKENHHEKLPKICEVPTTIASCPTHAIRPDAKTKGLKINNDRCMYCGNCYTMCPALPLMDAEGDGIYQDCENLPEAYRGHPHESLPLANGR